VPTQTVGDDAVKTATGKKLSGLAERRRMRQRWRQALDQIAARLS
jgi:hypothetical protein